MLFNNTSNKFARWWLHGGKFKFLRVVLVITYVAMYLLIAGVVIVGIITMCNLSKALADEQIFSMVLIGILIMLGSIIVIIALTFLMTCFIKGEINFCHFFYLVSKKLKISDSYYHPEEKELKVVSASKIKEDELKVPQKEKITESTEEDELKVPQKEKITESIVEDSIVKRDPVLGDKVILKKNRLVSPLDHTEIEKGTVGLVISISGNSFLVELYANGRKRIISAKSDEIEVI